jgi:hypothetical protein
VARQIVPAMIGRNRPVPYYTLTPSTLVKLLFKLASCSAVALAPPELDRVAEKGQAQLSMRLPARRWDRLVVIGCFNVIPLMPALGSWSFPR